MAINKTHIEIRKIFIRLNQAGKSAREIADITGVQAGNIYKKYQEKSIKESQ